MVNSKAFALIKKKSIQLDLAHTRLNTANTASARDNAKPRIHINQPEKKSRNSGDVGSSSVGRDLGQPKI